MELRDRAYQAETEAISCCVAAAFEPCETPRDPSQVGVRDTKSIINNLHADHRARSRSGHSHDRVFGRVSLSIFEQVDHRLRKQLAVSVNLEAGFDGPQEDALLVFESGRIALAKLDQHRSYIDRREETSSLASFDFGHAED